jgi:hypothetical protein
MLRRRRGIARDPGFMALPLRNHLLRKAFPQPIGKP